jgi:hypothetical protein
MKRFVTGDLIDLCRQEFAFTFNVAGTIAQSATTPFQFITGSYDCIVISYGLTSGTQPIQMTVREAPTVTDGTSAVTPLHLNRNYSSGSSITGYSNPTSISGGTTILTSLIPSGGNKSGGVVGNAVIWTMKKNSDYTVQLANLGNNDTLYQFSWVWLEDR